MLIPHDLIWVLSYECSSHCSGCYTHHMNRLIPTIHDEQHYRQLINWIAENEFFRVALTGGEPTDLELLPFIVSELATSEIFFTLATNGIDTSKVIAVARHENCLGVGITLYGHTPEQHDAYLGAGTFEQILQTLESLRQESLPFSLSVSFDATNIPQAEATLSFVVSQRPTGVRCQVLRDPLTGMVMASPAELCQLSAVIREVAASHLVTIGCDVHPAKDLQIPGATYQGCPVGRHILSLLPNGDITGCPRFMQHDNRLGRVATHSLLDVIQAEQHHFEERFWNKDYCPLARSLSIG